MDVVYKHKALQSKGLQFRRVQRPQSGTMEDVHYFHNPMRTVEPYEEVSRAMCSATEPVLNLFTP